MVTAKAEETDQLVEGITERRAHDRALSIGRQFDRLAQRAPGLGQRTIDHETSRRQSGLGLVELRFRPGTGADVAAQGEAPVELGQ